MPSAKSDSSSQMSEINYNVGRAANSFAYASIHAIQDLEQRTGVNAVHVAEKGFWRRADRLKNANCVAVALERVSYRPQVSERRIDSLAAFLRISECSADGNSPIVDREQHCVWRRTIDNRV